MVSRAILTVKQLDTGKHHTILLGLATVIKHVGNVDSFEADVDADCVMLTFDFPVCYFGCYSGL